MCKLTENQTLTKVHLQKLINSQTIILMIASINYLLICVYLYLNVINKYKNISPDKIEFLANGNCRLQDGSGSGTNMGSDLSEEQCRTKCAEEAACDAVELEKNNGRCLRYAGDGQTFKTCCANNGAKCYVKKCKLYL